MRRARLRERKAALRALRRLGALLDALPSAHGHDERVALVTSALTDVLHLRDCWYEPAPLVALPALDPDGTISTMVQHRVDGGLVLPDVVAIAVSGGGRYVLAGRRGVGTSVEERVIACTMTSVVALVATTA